jgi:putative endonuclease
MKPLAPHLLLGQRGEEIAAAYLSAHGYDILARNVRIEHDEIDIIAFDPEDNIVVFVEVKTRASASADFPPSMNAHWKKWRRLRRGMHRWIAEHRYAGGYRIDLLSVVDAKVTEHLQEVGLTTG